MNRLLMTLFFVVMACVASAKTIRGETKNNRVLATRRSRNGRDSRGFTDDEDLVLDATSLYDECCGWRRRLKTSKDSDDDDDDDSSGDNRRRRSADSSGDDDDDDDDDDSSSSSRDNRRRRSSGGRGRRGVGTCNDPDFDDPDIEDAIIDCEIKDLVRALDDAI